MRRTLRRAQASIWALLLILNIVLLPVTAHANADGNDSQGIQLRLSSSKDTVLTGATFTYTIDYSLSSTTEDYSDAEIVLPLPEGIVFEEVQGSEHVVSKHENVGGVDKVTFTFKNPTPSGATGKLQVKAHFPNHTTPDGTAGTATATFIHHSGSLQVESNPVTVTGKASADWILTKERIVPVEGVKPQPGTEVVYEIMLKDNKNPADKDGNLNIDHVVITDVLPPEAEFSKAAPAPDSIQGQTLTWKIDAKELNKEKITDRSKSILVTVKYPKDKVIDPSTGNTKSVVNTAKASYQPLGDAAKELTAKAEHDFIKQPGGGIWIYKQIWSGQEKELSEGQEVSFYIGGVGNAANVSLDKAVMTDMTPKGMKLQYIRIPAFDGADKDEYEIQYTSKSTPDESDWKLWKELNFKTQHKLLAADLNADIQGIRLVLGDVPVAFRPHDVLELRYQLTSYDSVKHNDYKYGDFPRLTEKYPHDDFTYLDKNNGLPTNEEAKQHPKQWKQTINYASMEYSFNGEKTEYLTGVKVLAVDKRPLLEVDKSVVSGKSTSPGGTVTYRIVVTNASPIDVPFRDPVVTDLLPKELEYVPDSLKLGPLNGKQMPAPAFSEAKQDQQGRTPITWAWGTEGSNSLTLQKGEALTFTFEARVKPDTPTGEVYNEVEVTSERHNYINGLTNFKNQRYKEENGKWYVYNGDKIDVNGIDSLISEKWVQGDLDNGQWSKYPDIGNVAPGGELKYKISITNRGSIGVKNLLIVDALPHIGDHGVIDKSSRGSKWTPILKEPISPPNGVTVYYSIDEEISMSGGNWDKEPPQDISKVRALKFEFAGDVILAPGQSKELTWTMRAPVDTPAGDDQIAWNSFGYTATPVISDKAMLPAEPLKVGIKIKGDPKGEIGDYVWYDENGNGIQDEAPDHGVNGVRVDLHRESDGKVIQSTVTGNNHEGQPGYYLFTGLDAGKYYVTFHLPEGYDAFTVKDTITNPGRNSKANVEGRTDIITLEQGGKNHNIDAGLIKKDIPSIPGKGAIGKYVWIDTNGNGIQDENGTGLNGVVVELYNHNNEKLTTTVTHSVYYSSVTNSVYDPTVTGSVYDPAVTDYVYQSGYYLFNELDLSTYKIRFIAPEGYSFTKRYQGDDRALDSDADLNGWSDNIVLTAERPRDLTIDAGLIVRTVNPDPEPGTGGSTDPGGGGSTNPGTPVEPGKPGDQERPTIPGTIVEPGTGNPDSETKPDPGEVTQPDGDTKPDKGQGTDKDPVEGTNEDEADGTDLGGEQDVDRQPNRPNVLPKTGEQAPIEPIIGIFLCAAAVIMWRLSKRGAADR
ncbi:hypothetical protein AZ66_00795 [Paenibacillus sp. E194]|uniref:SdrD B-like domain-containing protein n=1 Tax=Paenibacillus sp. E194 TaxID=1458845 RepID=UPI0005C8AC83|nr:SdrD B-like domain-containing protein [Paenibacillus sp. E194]KJB89603.1 hypothetical protein AZ66_00795 [Paenibacillus sp. E194]